MKKCPNCRRTFNACTYQGWVVQARGSITFDENGTIASVGPAVATTTIKAGNEVDGLHTTITCPYCKYQAHASSFPVSAKCILTGEEATVSENMKYPVSKIMLASPDLIAVAKEIFDPERLHWRLPEDENIFTVFRLEALKA